MGCSGTEVFHCGVQGFLDLAGSAKLAEFTKN